MKNIHGLKILFFLLLLSGSLLCQWEQTNGPYGGSIDAIAVHDSNIFAATGSWVGGGNVFLSTNSGKSWNEVNSGLPLTWVQDLVITPDGKKLFALTDSGIFYSTNNGATWINIGPKLSFPSINLSMAVYQDSSGQTNILAGTYYNGIYITTDLGASWKELNPTFKPEISSISVIGSRIFTCTYQRTYLSTDGGNSWKAVTNIPKDSYGNTAWPLKIVPAPDSSTLFACTGWAGVLISKDNGESWATANTGITDKLVSCLAFSGENLFAGTLEGVYKSTNNGIKWVHMGLKDIDVRALAVQNISGSSNINIFAGAYSGEGIFLSTDLSKNWVEANEGLACGNIGGLTVMPDRSGKENLFVGHLGRGIMKSTDNGASWTKIISGLPPKSYSYDFSFYDKYLATYSENRIYLSSDYGQNWNDITKNLSDCYTNCNIGALLVYSDNKGGVIIFLGTNGGLYSTKFDSTKYVPWELSNTGVFEVRSFAVIGKDIFAVAGKVFRSSNNGASWTPVISGLPENPSISTIAVYGENLLAAVYEKGIYFSSDNGDNWHKLTPGLRDSIYVNSFAVAGTRIFACSYDSIYLSTDNGKNWKKISEGLSARFPWKLAVGSSYLFSGTYGNSVWRLPLSGIVADVKSPTEVPMKFSLEQNFPNPFNPATTIKFSLPYPSHVTLKVYNLLGQEAATLINEEKSAGLHHAVWQADGITSGIYFYEIKAGGFIQTKKMILLR